MSRLMYCTTCGAVTKPKTVTRGSSRTELVLWLLLIVPGMIYSIWRFVTRHQGCADCGAADLVPPDSPAARLTKLIKGGS